MHGTHHTPASDQALRRVLWAVALANLAYFFVEGGGALLFRSVALFADSVDFLEDAAVNLLVLLALGWSLARRARLGIVLAGITLIPAAGALWTAWTHIAAGTVPDAVPMTVIGVGALIVNALCAVFLSRHQDAGGSLTKAAFLCARNDVLANGAIILTGLITLYYASPWPDVVVGLGIAALNIDAAREIYEEARREQLEARS